MASIRALVVGGTNGIGYGLANRLASTAPPSSSIIISGRTQPTNMPPHTTFRQLDASSMRGISKFTYDLVKDLEASPDTKGKEDGKLDYLIMTQGILTLAGRTETPERIDNKMALHYYGRQQLLKNLLPVLKADAKVLVVLDSKLGSPEKLNWDDLDLKTHYSLGNAAAHCTSMNDAMVQYYATHQKTSDSGLEEKRVFVHAFPGTVKTNIAREMPALLKPLASLAGALLAVSPEVCAENLLKGLDDAVAKAEKEGVYWSMIDDKGKLLDKPAWKDEDVQKVVDHTTAILDTAQMTLASKAARHAAYDVEHGGEN